MRGKNIKYIMFTLLLCMLNVSMVYAEFNMTEAPEYLSSALGVSTFAGEILASTILIMIFVFPIVLIKGKRGWLAELIVGNLVLSACIAIGWIPYWFLFIEVMLLAVLFSGSMRKWITGG